MDCLAFLTLVVPDLPIHILRQATHVRKIKHHPIKASPLDFLPSPTTVRYSRFPKLGCVNPIPHDAILLRFEGGNVGGCLWVFASERGDLVVASCDYVSAAVGAEKGVGEGEVAFADEEDAVGGGKGDVRGVRFRAVCGLARRELGF